MVVTVESSHNSETTAMAGLQLPVIMNETNPFSGQIHLFYVDTRGAGIAQWLVLDSWGKTVTQDQILACLRLVTCPPWQMEEAEKGAGGKMVTGADAGLFEAGDLPTLRDGGGWEGGWR